LMPASPSSKTNDRTVEAFVEAYPQWKRPGREWDQFVFGDQADVQLRQAVRHHMHNQGRHYCDCIDGMKHQMALARNVLADQPPGVKERFLYDAVKETVTHEVGHTLGLRHNFKASTIYSLEEIKKRRLTDQPTCGSVMDYNPALLFADGVTEGHFMTPTIGPYDYWAIEYGYRPYDQHYKSSKAEQEQEQKKEQEAEADKPKEETPAPAAPDIQIPPEILEQIPKDVLEQMPPEVRQMLAEVAGEVKADLDGAVAPKEASGGFKAPPSGEKGMLLEIASRSTQPELAYATDEDSMSAGPDPRVNKFDAGRDPIDWAETRIELVNKRMANILEWAVKDQESWYHLRQAYVRLLFEKAIVLDYVGRYIGGQYFNRAHRGEANAEPPFVLVEPAKQRQALAFIEKRLYGDDFFSVPPEVLNHLAPSRWWHDGTRVSFSMDFPVHRMVSFFQWWNLFDRLFPNTLRRIHDAEMKTDAKDKFTLAEYLQRVQSGCWQDATDVERLTGNTWTDASPFLSDVRRSLQREYLGAMEPLVRTSPGTVVSPDIHAMVKHSLRGLAKELDAVIAAGKADFASQAHLTACKSRIDRMLDPELKEYGW